MSVIEMTSLGFQRLLKYSEFLDQFSNKNRNLMHLGITARRYFYFAELQIRNFESNLKLFFDADNNVDYSEACYSNAFSFYTLIRTSLEASRKLSDEIQTHGHAEKLQKYREDNSVGINNIITIANDIVKHPLEDAVRAKIYFYEPGGLDTFGNMDIYEWSTVDNRDIKVLEINPINDCNTIFGYLEGLAEAYLDVIKSY